MDRKRTLGLFLFLLLLARQSKALRWLTDSPLQTPTSGPLVKTKDLPPNQNPPSPVIGKSSSGSALKQPPSSLEKGSLVNSIPPSLPLPTPVTAVETNKTQAEPGESNKDKALLTGNSTSSANGKKENLRPSSPNSVDKNKQNKLPPLPSAEDNKPSSPPSNVEEKDKQKNKALPPPITVDNKNEGKNSPQSDSDKDETRETCPMIVQQCRSSGIVACLQYPTNGLDKPYILIQNIGEKTLTVNIKAAPSINIDTKMLEVPIRKSRKVNFSGNAAESSEIVLNKNCILHTRSSLSIWNSLHQLPAYATHVTPVHGSFFLAFTFLLIGGTWACCKLRKKGTRTDTGVAYQQLEMGVQPVSSSANVADIEADAVDNWDDGWGKDWDEDVEMPRPSAKQPVSTISSNGLTSRTTNKDNEDGWDIDWDD